MQPKLIALLGASLIALAACADSDTSTATVDTEALERSVERPVERTETLDATAEVDMPTATQADIDAGLSLRDNFAALPADYRRIVAASNPAGEIGEEVTNLTLFVPTDATLREMGAERVTYLTDREHRDEAYAFYADMAMTGTMDVNAIKAKVKASPDGVLNMATPRGTNIQFRTDGAGNLIVTNPSGVEARIVEADKRTADGMIHTVDAVLGRSQ